MEYKFIASDKIFIIDVLQLNVYPTNIIPCLTEID